MAEIASVPPYSEPFRSFAVPLPQRVTGFPPARLIGAGRILCRQGDPAETVFFVERGLVKLNVAHPDGSSERIVGLRSDGWVIGAASAITNEACVTTARTALPSRCSMLPATEFRRLLADDGVFSCHVHRMLAREASLGLQQLGDELRPARERLARLLRALVPGERRGALLRGDLPFRQWEIAQMIGVRPQYLSTLLAQLGLDGAFRGHGGGRRRGDRDGDEAAPLQ